MSSLMMRWLGLPLLFVTAATWAAETDSAAELAERPGRPIHIAQAAESEAARKVNETSSQFQAVDARLAKIESRLQEQSSFALLREIELLKAELSRLRGQTEMHAHQIESLGGRQTDLYADLDKRIDDLGKQVKAAVVPPPVQETSPPLALVPSQEVAGSGASPEGAAGSAQTTEAAPPQDPLAESKSYETALNQFKASNYAAAIAGFKSFLKAYPGSSLAPNAQYWIGYAYYAQKDYKAAITHQQSLVNKYPKNAKVPDALLNIANSQSALKDEAAAKKTLEEIVAKHPGSGAAKVAAKRLAVKK